MSSIRLPEAIPIPQRDSLTTTFEQSNQQNPFEIGAARSRRTRSLAPRLWTITFIMSLVQFQLFEDWYQNTIKGGSFIFDMQLLDDDDTLVWYTVNIVGEYTYANVGTAYDRWTVTMTVRSRLPSFAVRDPGTAELRGAITVGTDLTGLLHVPFIMRGAVTVGTELKGLLHANAMRGMITVGTELTGNLSLTGAGGFELRADGSRELRADGSFELRQ